MHRALALALVLGLWSAPHAMAQRGAQAFVGTWDCAYRFPDGAMGVRYRFRSGGGMSMDLTQRVRGQGVVANGFGTGTWLRAGDRLFVRYQSFVLEPAAGGDRARRGAAGLAAAVKRSLSSTRIVRVRRNSWEGRTPLDRRLSCRRR